MTMFKMTGALVLATAALGASGCGGGGGDSEQTQEGAGTSKVVEPAAEEEKTTSQGDAKPAPQGVLATREGKIEDLPVKLEVTELTRSGDTMTLGLSLALTEGDSDSPGAQIADAFDDEDQEEGDHFSMDGITLIDSTNAKRYLVARDSDGGCVCDDQLADEFVQEDPPSLLSATYGAPPEDVDALDLEIPRFGVIRDVPIS